MRCDGFIGAGEASAAGLAAGASAAGAPAGGVSCACTAGTIMAPAKRATLKTVKVRFMPIFSFMPLLGRQFTVTLVASLRRARKWDTSGDLGHALFRALEI